MAGRRRTADSSPGSCADSEPRASARTTRSAATGPSWCRSTLRVGTDASGRATAALDLTRFSSWAREDEPARIVFGADRRPETITATLILGTSLAIRIEPAPTAAS